MTDEKPKILIVDDERFYISVLVDMLQDDYRVAIAKDGEQALQRLADGQLPDLILLDWLMPGMDGLSVCQKIKATPATADIPVIFLTIKSEIEDEIAGFEAGAVDYIRKPMSPPIVMARISTHLDLLRTRKQLQAMNDSLEQAVAQRTRELENTKDVAIYCMASLAETRDNETGYHIRRTQHYVKALAEEWRKLPGNQDLLSDNDISLLFKSAPLHDIGKVGVPDRILLKPGKLDEAEWEEMKMHATYGKEAIDRAEEELGSSTFLTVAKEIAYTHHERWDGSGYPRGLKGPEIPLSGRLMAIADVYDALISRRVYKGPFSHEEAIQNIASERGTHFDPVLVDLLLQNKDRFAAIAAQYADENIDEVMQ